MEKEDIEGEKQLIEKDLFTIYKLNRYAFDLSSDQDIHREVFSSHKSSINTNGILDIDFD